MKRRLFFVIFILLGMMPFVPLEATPIAPQRALAQDPGFSMLIVSDTQFPWWRAGADPDAKNHLGELCDDLLEGVDAACHANYVKAKAIETNQNMVDAMNAINNRVLATWPTSFTNGDDSFPKPGRVIFNGDLTNYFHPDEFAQFKEFYYENALVHNSLSQDFTRYPGLGNHDYANNVGNCTPSDSCAKEAVWWMADQIHSDGIPGIVNKDLSGSVSVTPAGLTKIELTYKENGVQISPIVETFDLGIKSVNIPLNATDIKIKLYQADIAAKFHLKETITSQLPIRKCYEGIIFNGGFKEISCPHPPPDGEGSLAYSYDIDNYHFVQLHNWPGYTTNLPKDFWTGPAFRVTESYNWLRDDLQAATAAGKRIVINMHDASEYPINTDSAGKFLSQGIDQDTSFLNAISNTNVVAIFAGHIHQDYGEQTTINNGYTPHIPVILSGSAECETFLLAEFQANYFDVGVVDADGGTPEIITDPTHVCDDRYPWSTFVKPNGKPKTVAYEINPADPLPKEYAHNFAPIVNIHFPTPGIKFKTDTAISFRALGIDPDKDNITYTWDFGDGTSMTSNGPSGLTNNVTHSFTSAGTYEVKVEARDGSGLGVGPYGSKTIQVTIIGMTVNPPTVEPEPSNEGSSVVVSSTFSDTAGNNAPYTCTISYGDGSEEETFTASGNTCTGTGHTYADNDTYEVSVRVTDKDSRTGQNSSNHTVNNVPPTITADVTASEINEGGEVTISGKITDPGIELDEFGVEIDWSDGNTTTLSQTDLTLVPGNPTAEPHYTYSATHQYRDDSPADGYPIQVTVTDDDDGVGTANTTVTVNNVAPTVEEVQLSANSIDENGEVTLSGAFSDPGILDTPFVVDITWGDGNIDTNVEYDPETKTFSRSHQYLDDGLTDQPSDDYEITISVVDKDGGEGGANITVTVNNVAPAVTFDGPTYLIKRQTFQGSGSFVDPGTQDTWTATVDYGDGSGLQELTLTDMTFTLSRTYTVVGTPRVEVCVTDDDQGRGCSSLQVEVISFQQANSDLCELVEGLKDEGVLNNGQVNSLCAKLDAASQQLDKESDATAVQQIEAFINEVEAHVESGKLTLNQGQTLIDSAQVIITLINTEDEALAGSDLTGAAMGDAPSLIGVGIMMGVLAIGGSGYAIWTRFKKRNPS